MSYLPRLRLSANQSRIAYDLLAAAAAAAFSALFALRFLGLAPWVLALAPALLVAANRAVGIYTRLRVATGGPKVALLSVAVALSAAALIALEPRSLPAGLLWAALVWPLLVLPRWFLNLNTRANTFATSAVQENGPVLVVGGAGYIGTHVVEQLLKADYRVRVLDKLLYGSEPMKDFAGDPRVELIEGDCTDIVKLVQAVDGVSAVVHLAGLVGDPACAVDDSFTRHANVIATKMVKEIAISLGIQRFIFASSCSVYGATDQEVDETSVLNPVSLYARTKIDSENELMTLGGRGERFSPTILRFATVFGHSRRPRFDLVGNLFTAQAMIDGKITVMGENQWRPFIHVRDLARAVVAVLKADPEITRDQTFNVGDRRLNMTIGALAEEVKRIVSRERPVEIVIRPDVNDRRNYMVNFDKIRRVLKFEATTLLEAGIQDIVEEFKKGTYGHYKEATYSNLEMTKRALSLFQDPQQSARLYGPLHETQPAPRSQAGGLAAQPAVAK